MTHKAEAVGLMIRLPLDCKEWLQTQAARNISSQRAEIVRCIRHVMEAEQAKAAR